MTYWLKLAFVMILSTSFVACGGGSGEKKAQDKASDMTTEYNNLVKELNSSGLPSSSWSDEQLVKYEAKLNRMESLQASLDHANGKNGVYISGGDNKTFIQQRRQLISSARSEKAKVVEKKQNQEKIQELQTLLREVQDIQLDLVVKGQPDSSWSIEKLRAYETSASESITKIDRMTSILNSITGSSKDKKDILDSLKVIKTESESKLQYVQKIILDSMIIP